MAISTSRASASTCSTASGRGRSAICSGAIPRSPPATAAPPTSAEPPAWNSCEPLTFKGREGSGHPGGRNAYADASLVAWRARAVRRTSTPPRSSPSPTSSGAATSITPTPRPDFYHRYLAQAFGPAGPALETALAASSRILPLVTTAWCPSASNHEFWPEMFTSLLDPAHTGRPLYTDSPAPHNVSAISPLDPQLFTTIDQHAKDLISGTKNARYNSSEVIAVAGSDGRTSTKGLAAARTAAGSKARTPEFRRAEEDILILNGLGTYYANLFRAALFYSHPRTNRRFRSLQHNPSPPIARPATPGPPWPQRPRPSTPPTSATAQPPSAAATGPTALPRSTPTSPLLEKHFAEYVPRHQTRPR
jgi:hypothetical protein